LKPDLSVKIGSLNLKNPVLTASGTFGYGLEYSKYFDPALLGGIITKTVTLEPRAGNPMPRIAETPAGMLNSIGLANVGADVFLESKLPELEALQTAVIANIAGNTVEEYCLLLQKIAKHPRVDAIEVNVSCPNVEQGGLAFGADASVIEEILHCMRPETDKPLIIKLTPNVTDIQSIAAAAESAGADALSLINTVLGMGVDIRTRKPLLARVTGGLSGPAIKPIALAKVYQVAQIVSIPIIGLGGIMTGEDAVEFFIAGASAVQVGTLNFVQPDGALQVISGIEKYCADQGVERIRDLVGTLKEV
jgi:dihydroorotate dehydrogenase (NAD+) catalytic subunit